MPEHQDGEKQMGPQQKTLSGRASLCIAQGSGTPSTVGPALVFLAGQKKPLCPKGYHPSATCCKAQSHSAPRALITVWHLFAHLATLLHSNHPDPSLACHQQGSGCAEQVSCTAVRGVLVRAQAGHRLPVCSPEAGTHAAGTV